MGGEFAQQQEWNHDQELNWDSLDNPQHKNIQSLIRDLNNLYRNTAALHELDCDESGFEWIDHENADQSILIYLRKNHDASEIVLVVVNLTPSLHSGYKVGVPLSGHFEEILNTDADCYGGSNAGNFGGLTTTPEAYSGQSQYLSIEVPPLATLAFKWVR